MVNDQSLWPPDCGLPQTVSPDFGAREDVVTQLLAQGLITRVNRQGNINTEWMLTDVGISRYVELRAIRRTGN